MQMWCPDFAGEGGASDPHRKGGLWWVAKVLFLLEVATDQTNEDSGFQDEEIVLLALAR